MRSRRRDCPGQSGRFLVDGRGVHDSQLRQARGHAPDDEVSRGDGHILARRPSRRRDQSVEGHTVVRVRVRPGTYEGFIITGPQPGSAWPTSVFTDGSEAEARWIAQAIKAGQQWTFT